MKIAFLVHDFHRSGGHSRYVAELAQRYAAAHEVHVFANTFRGEIDPRITQHRVPAWRANALTLILSFRWNASRMLRGWGFDIVHDQGLCCNRANVLTAHICNAAWSAARPHPTASERVFGAIVSRLETLQYRRAGTAHVIAVSSRVRDDLACFYKFHGNVSVIYHGVDTVTFSPANRALWRTKIRAETGVPEGETLFLFVGDLRKGAEAAARALPHGRLLCVSGTPKLTTSDRVIFHGPTDHIERFYAAADVFLLPTPYDAFGMVVLEAMASGLPVIVSQEAGAAELIRHGDNGFVSQNPEQLPGLMQQALAHPKIAIAARETALEHTWDRVARETLAVYEKALTAPRILAFATQGAGGNDETRLRTLLNRGTAGSLADGLSVHFFPFNHAQKLSSLRNLLRTLAQSRYSLAIMEGTGIAGGAALLTARLLFGQHYIVSSGDAVGPFIAAKQPALGWLFTLYEKLLYRHASGFIGWSPYLTGRALTFGVKRAATAPGWAEHPSRPIEHKRPALGIAPDALVLGIVGSLDWNPRAAYCYGFELVRAMTLIERKDAVMLIVGGGTGLARLQKIGGPRVIFTGPVPRDEIPAYLAAMDIASLPQSCDGVGSFRYTTKLSEYLAAGLPVVTGQIPLAYDLDDGWLWRLPGNAPWDERYTRALAALIDSLTPATLAAKKAAVPVNSPLFDRSKQIVRVKELIRDILESL